MKRTLLFMMVVLSLLVMPLVFASPQVDINSPDNATFFTPLESIVVSYNLSEYLRISIGLEADNKEVIRVLAEFLGR